MEKDEQLMKLRHIILSWDLILAVVITLITAYVSSFLGIKSIEIAFIKFTEMGVTILSVIFPLFFAAMTIIITASDDDFAAYLHKRGFLNRILASFKFTLLLTFIAFFYSIILFIVSNYLFSIEVKWIVYAICASYLFFFLYSLFSVLNSILDSMSYARLRGDYFSRKQR